MRPEAQQGPVATRRRGATAAVAAGLVGSAIVLVLLRLHAFDLPLETDECNYAYIGARLLEGQRLYVDVWDHQPFGVFALFAGAIGFFGDAPVVFRLLAMGFSLATLVLSFDVLRRMHGVAAGLAGALLFAIVSSDPSTAGEGCNREIFMNTLVVAAWWAALWTGPRRAWGEVAAGAALGVGSTIKTLLAVHWVVLVVVLVVRSGIAAERGRRARVAAGTLGRLSVAPLVIWIGAFGYFGLDGRLGEFVEAVFLFNLGYAGGGSSFLERFVLFFAPPRHPFVFAGALPVWLATIPACAVLIAEGIRRGGANAVLLVALVGAGFVATCLPAHFWPHYYYLLIPPAVLATTAAAAVVVERLRSTDTGNRGRGARSHRRGSAKAGEIPPETAPDALRRAGPGARSWAVGVFAVLPLAALLTESREYIRQSPLEITIERYNTRDFWGRAMGEKVRAVTDPADTVFVFGSDTAIYYYSRRRCASRFTMITGIAAGYEGAVRRRERMLEDLRRTRPRLIIVLFDEQPWDEWRALLADRYTEPIGWDYHDRTGEPIMFVLTDKERPVAAIEWNWDRSEVGEPP
jgi:hypothetical protein